MDYSFLAALLEFISIILSLAGAAVIVYGALFSMYHYILELFGLAHKGRGLNIDHIRLEFSRNIVLGLEFFVAADLIQTVIVPGYYEIGLLGALVVIRTVLSFFLNREIIRMSPPDRNKLR